jgi:hypothetical protein
MYQHLDMMAAQSTARERERQLQVTLRQRQGVAQRASALGEPPAAGWHEWLHDMLVRAHLTHATPH